MGRPKLDDDDKRQQVNFRVSPEMLTVIKALAEADGESVPRFIERMVTEALMGRLSGKFK